MSALYQINALLKRGYSSLRSSKTMFTHKQWHTNRAKLPHSLSNSMFDLDYSTFTETLLPRELRDEIEDEVTTVFKREVVELPKFHIATMEGRSAAGISTLDGLFPEPAKDGTIDW